MVRTISIVEARRELGRLADEVRRTRRPVILTNRGRPVARIAPEPRASTMGRRRGPDPFGGLRGTIQVVGSLDELDRAIRSLKKDFARNLERRAGQFGRRTSRNA